VELVDKKKIVPKKRKGEIGGLQKETGASKRLLGNQTAGKTTRNKSGGGKGGGEGGPGEPSATK